MNLVKRLDTISIFLIVMVVISAFYFNDVLPDRIITHWNTAGEPDDYGSKSVQVIFLPLIMVGLYFLFKILPKLDPKIRHPQDFGKVYKVLQLSIISFFTVLYFVTSLVNIGWDIAINRVVPLLVGVLFIVIGLYLKDIKPNWFLGIRTPWTLSSDVVWRETHKYGAKVFSLAGLLFIVMSFMPEGAAIYLFILLIALILSSIGYSYFAYRKHK